ncbi:phage portal protein [Cupriavidus oxalaticus]|uniref:Phage portal protein n=1 Tax=Cupriavidus oxalaticus TaxID=96344 RepID=A0A4V1BZQ5_9BURK|nr:phage portal protein [Cupriavidus oxalaticus]QBY56142.1 phage portal protein [Cupriavidus oxalaticus]
MNLFQRFGAAAQAFRSPLMASGGGNMPVSGTAPAEPWLMRLFGGGKSRSGQYVSPDSALRVTAVYAATRIIAESMASLPISVYQKSGGKRSPVHQHNLVGLLHDAANPNNTAFEFVEMGQAHLSLRGNAYSFIEGNGKGEIEGLYPQHPDKVSVRYDESSRLFVYDIDGERNIPARQVLHIRGFSLDGLVGLSPIALARETIGLALAAEELGNEAFAEGFVPPVVLEVTEKAGKDQRDTYRKQWTELTRDRRAGPPVISGGTKLHTLRVSMSDLQFLESRRFSIAEIARLFRVPPHMLADLEKATFSNIEHLSLEFVKFTLAPWIKRWEQRMNLTLFSSLERDKGLYVKFNVDALLRGDIKSRYEAYKIGLENRILNANNCREMEDMDGYEGGDEFWAPLNMAPVSVSRQAKGGSAA